MRVYYIIIIILAVIILLFTGFYFYYHYFFLQSQGEILYNYKVGNSKITSSTSFTDIDKESSRVLAQKAIEITKNADYKFECLVFDSSEKGIDERDGKEFWGVRFSCNELCSKTYINCGAVVIIRNNYEMFVGFPN